MIWKFFFWESSLTSILLPQMGKDLQMKIYNKYFMPSIKDDSISFQLFIIVTLSPSTYWSEFLHISIKSNGTKGHPQNT